MVYPFPIESKASSIFRGTHESARGESSCKIQRKICPAHTRCHRLHVQADARTDAASWDFLRTMTLNREYFNSKNSWIRRVNATNDFLPATNIIKHLPNIRVFLDGDEERVSSKYSLGYNLLSRPFKNGICNSISFLDQINNFQRN